MKVLIVGLGSIAKKHIQALKEINSKVEIYALRSRKNATVYKDVVNLYSWEELSSRSFDFGIIASPTALHEEHVRSLLPFKFPLFIEKPLSHTLQIGQLKSDLKDLKTYIACNLRFLDALEYVKQEILAKTSERIQEVSAYCGSYLPHWRAEGDFRENYSARPELGGGVHLDLIHEIDYVYWLFGKPNHQSQILKSQSSLEINSKDYAHYCFSYEGFEATIKLNYFRPTPKRTLEIVFETFIIQVDLLQNKVFKNDVELFVSDQKPIETYKKQLHYFINTETTFNSFEEAFEVLELCLNGE